MCKRTLENSHCRQDRTISQWHRSELQNCSRGRVGPECLPLNWPQDQGVTEWQHRSCLPGNLVCSFLVKLPGVTQRFPPHPAPRWEVACSPLQPARAPLGTLRQSSLTGGIRHAPPPPVNSRAGRSLGSWLPARTIERYRARARAVPSPGGREGTGWESSLRPRADVQKTFVKSLG